MFNTYETHYIQSFATKVTKEFYTKAVWSSLDEIKGYINYVKKKAIDYNLVINGIDVFFCVYNKDSNLELKSNAQTIFLAASIQKHTIINTQNELLKNYIQHGFFSKEDTSDEDESITFNEGELSPPPQKTRFFLQAYFIFPKIFYLISLKNTLVVFFFA